MLVATDQYTKEMPSHGIENGKRIRGLVLLLRYSGMCGKQPRVSNIGTEGSDRCPAASGADLTGRLNSLGSQETNRLGLMKQFIQRRFTRNWPII